MIGQEIQGFVSKAVVSAQKQHHRWVLTEHIFLEMLRSDRGQEVFTALGMNVDNLEAAVSEFVSEHNEPSKNDEDIHMSQTVMRLLDQSLKIAQRDRRDVAEADDLLIAILTTENDSWIHSFMVANSVTEAKLKRALQVSSEDDDELESEYPALAEFAVELVADAEDGLLDPLIGRDIEISRAIQVLSRRKKNNPIFVGEAGVGKTALVEGLALRIANGQVPKRLKNSKVYSVDLGSMIAGTKFRGEFEERLKSVIEELEAQEDAIMFIDEIHTLIGAGATGSSSLDASNLLKPALSSGTLRCVGTTTHDEFRKVFEKNAAMSRRFQKIAVDEPSLDETKKILHGLSKKYARFHDVEYSDAAIDAIAELSATHIQSKFLPDKAIDVLDEAGAAASLADEDEVSVSLVEEIVAKIAKIPVKTVSEEETDKLQQLRPSLLSSVYGQNDAMLLLTKHVFRSRSGLQPLTKPVGSFLFTGSTGVGKTEAAKTLASTLGVQLLRFDMSEYMEKHAISRLIGAPPGYIGYDQGGLLTEAVSKTPHCVLLLDEIEKAHPDLFSILLQVMDNGTLTDTAGKVVNFKNTILIMTSNTGAREMAARSIGFGSQEQKKTAKTAVDKMFSPEFRNRLDATVEFQPLEMESILKIVDRELDHLKVSLAEKNVKLKVSTSAKTKFAAEGFSTEFGARPLIRLISEKLIDALTEELLFGKLKNGGTVSVGVKSNEFTFQIQELEMA